MKVKIILLMFTLLGLLISTSMHVCANDDPPFTLPDKGCYMAHCDPCQSDNNFMPIPEKNVGVVWYHRDLAGEQMGTLGLGFSEK